MSSHSRLVPTSGQTLYADTMPAPLRFEAGTTFSDDLKLVIDALRRRRRVFFLGFVSVLILAACWVYFSIPLFTATTTVVLDPRKTVVTSSPEVLSDVEPDSTIIETQVQLILSRVVLGNVVDELGLQNGPGFSAPSSDRFAPTAGSDVTSSNPPSALAEESSGITRNDLIDAPRKIWTWLVSALGMRFNEPGLQNGPDLSEPSSNRFAPTAATDIAGSNPPPAPAGESSGIARNDLIDALRRDLDVARVGLTYALDIGYTDENPEHAARVANTVAAAYLEHQLDVKQQATIDANLWLNQHVSELREQVEAAEAAVDAYRSRSGLLVAQGSTSTESQLTNLDLGLNEARQGLSDAQARLAGYRGALDQLGPANAAEIVASAMMQHLRTQYAELTNQRAQLSPTLGSLHPQMVALSRQLDGLQEQMNVEAQRTIEELKSDVTIAENRVAGLLAIRDQSRTQLSLDNAANVELAQLQTSAVSLRQLYEEMLSRFKQTTAQETLGQVNARIVSEAVAPKRPSSPRTNVILASAVGIGLALGFFAVLLAQLFDNTVVRPEELERRTRVPILALVPQLQARDLKIGGKRVPIADVVLGKPMSLFAESFRNLRVAVMNVVGRDEPVVLQITSGTFAEGKTVCSIAFARTAAMDGKRVLLIDADVRRRSLTQSLGITAEIGLIELLRGKAELRDVIVPGVTNGTPDVIPLSAIDAGPHDLFSTEAFDSLLRKLKTVFDVIVIDSAPVLAVAEPLSLAKRVDAVVLVARWAKTPVEIVLKALEEINRVGGHVVGTLLTHVDVKKVTNQSYGRGYFPALMGYYR